MVAVNKIIIILLFLVSLSYSQNIRVAGGAFTVIEEKYTLPEIDLTYRIYGNKDECVLGGEMNYKDFYEWNYFSLRKGKYRIVIFKQSRIFINEIFEVK